MDGNHAAGSITRPIIKQKYQIEMVPGEGIFLLGENESHVLEGYELELVIPQLDGRKTIEEIAQSVSPVLSRAQVQTAIDFLAQRGHVHQADSTMPSQFAPFWNDLGVIDTSTLGAQFAGHPISIIDLVGGHSEGIAQAVQSFGMSLAPNGHVLIVAVDDYLDPRLDQINRSCLELGTPWLIFKPDGINIWIGPLFVPRSGPCWSCLATRLRENRDAERHVQARSQNGHPIVTTKARLWATRQQAYSMLATQLVIWLVRGANPKLEWNITIAETLSFQFSSHPVVRLPQCRSCGTSDASSDPGKQISFQARRSIQTQYAGERVESAETTFQKYQHHISPVTGVVRELAPTPWQSVSPLRSYVAGHNMAIGHNSLQGLKAGLRNLSSGKGFTDSQARTSALCEALERYSGVYRGDEPSISARLRDLDDEGIHPNDCMLFSDRQYEEREKWLSRGSHFNVVPLPFDPDTTLEWTPVFSHTHQQRKYLPTSYLYYSYPFHPEQFYCWADSNGNAAGTSIEDACLQAFYELVERDAVCIWWYNQIRRPALNLTTIADPYIESLQSYYASIGREFWLLDLTHDLEIPVFAAVNRRFSGPTEDIILGFGAHSDAQIAANRAIAEMNQFMPAVLNVGPDGSTQYGTDDPDTVNWWRSATTLNQPYLVPLSNSHSTQVEQNGRYVHEECGDILARLQACFDIVEKRGMEVLVLDQTRPEIGLPVVKVIVPGLRHFWARFAPGRLFDVPVAQKWLSRPEHEEFLNPVPMFL